MVTKTPEIMYGYSENRVKLNLFIKSTWSIHVPRSRILFLQKVMQKMTSIFYLIYFWVHTYKLQNFFLIMQVNYKEVYKLEKPPLHMSIAG